MRGSQIAQLLIQRWYLSRRPGVNGKTLFVRFARARRCAGSSRRERALCGRGAEHQPSSVVKWSQRFKATGSAAARRMGGYRRRVLVGEHAVFLRGRITQGDFTLRSLVLALAERGLKVDYRTVWAFVHREGLSFKKNRSAKRARPTWHCSQAGALESPSETDRSKAARLHR